MKLDRAIFQIICLCALLAANTLAFRPPDHAAAPNVDLRKPQPAADQLRGERAKAAAHLRGQLPAAAIDLDPVTGAPKFIRASDGFLTGPNGEGRAVTSASARAHATNDPHRAIKGFLTEHRALFGHGPEVLDGSRVLRDYADTHNGLRTVSWQQQLDGLDIHDSVLIGHVTRRGELVNLSSQFLPNPAKASGFTRAQRAAFLAHPGVTAEQALAAAVNSLSAALSPRAFSNNTPASAAAQRQKWTGNSIVGDAEVRLVWLPMSRSELRLCWEVVFKETAHGETFRALIDARGGELLLRRLLTAYLMDAAYRVFTSDSPSPFSPGHPAPSAAQPPAVARTLVTLPALNTNASPNGWIDDAVNEPRGNNAAAHLDRDANDSPDLPRPQGSPFRVFDFPMNLAQSPTNYSAAAVVQMFYLGNWMHDRLWELGFNEASGNFQNDNFGRGGLGNDAILLDAQDGSGFNNANYSPAGDGTAPRVQMYLFNGPTPDIDGDFDAEIVIHEYVHGLSDRLVGGGSGIGALQTAGMGEGWSDWYAITLLSESGDDLGGCTAAGGYATYQFYGLAENYYFGIRRYPYSTNFSKNPLTFKDIDPTQADDHAGIPKNPVIGGGGADEVHNQGEVWCATLWEARVNFINQHGFTIGNQLILQLVTDGMKLAPANPNFLQARDAILVAELILTGGTNRLALWRAFAKRGMGFFATSPDSSTTIGVIEDFSLPDDLLVMPNVGVTAAGPVNGPFTPLSQTYSLTNTGTNTLLWTAHSDGLFTLSSSGGALTPGAPGITVTATLSAAASNLPGGGYTGAIRFTNTTTGVAQTRPAALNISAAQHFTEGFEGPSFDLQNNTLTFTPDGSSDFYNLCRSSATGFPTDPAGGTPVYLGDDDFTVITLPIDAPVSLYDGIHRTVFLGGNGYLTFFSGDTTYQSTYPNHFSQPRVTALFDDLNPSVGGTISWRRLADRVAFTWQNVPEYGTTHSNTFQIEMFLDGVIRITHLAVAAEDCITGLSRGGGLPAGFGSADLSAYGPCLPPLTLQLPSSVNEHSGGLAGAGSVSIHAPHGADLTIMLTCFNPGALIVPATVTLLAGQTNVSFTLTPQDDSLLNGTRLARVRATSSGHRDDESIIAIHDNESATLSVTLPASATEGDGLLAARGIVTLGQTSSVPIIVHLSAGNTNELTIPSPALVIIAAGRTGAAFDLSVMDDPLLDGPQSAVITAQVVNWAAGSATMTIHDNEPATLALALPPQVHEGAGTLLNAGRVTASGIVSSNLTVSLASLNTAELLVPSSVIIPAGQATQYFNITVVDDAVLDDAQNVALTASRSGFLTATGTLLVADNEVPPAPYNPQPAHLATNIPATVRLSWLTGEGDQIINGSFETGGLVGWTREDTGQGAWLVNHGTLDPESPDGPSAPHAGQFSALARQGGSGTHALWQQITIPPGTPSATLQWTDRIRNFAATFSATHQFRVEIRNPFNSVITVPFATQPGSTPLNNWTTRSANLGAYRGQTLRIAFVEQDSLGHLDVHLDNVSVLLGSPGPESYDVYFGTHPAPGPAEFLGNTTNTFWDPPVLPFNTTFHWRVIARRLGASTPGPVWQFSTRPSLAPATFISLGDAWRYLDNGTDRGAAWRSNTFNDTTWSNGPAMLGYGDANGSAPATTTGYGPDAANKFITTYFRRAFVIPTAGAVISLNARLQRDDGAVVYLNGAEVWRDNMPAGVLTHTNRASATVNGSNEGTLFTRAITNFSLVNGTNIVAVEIHQDSPSSSDIAFDFELTGAVLNSTNTPPTVTLTNPANYAILRAPASLLLQATAGDSGGSVTNVDFYANGTRLGGDASSPYSFTWSSPPFGNHTLTAVAFDNLGATTVSAPLTVVVARTNGTEITLVPRGAGWLFLDDGSAQGTAWRASNFNDSGWFTGLAELGYGDNDEATVLNYGPSSENKFITTYFRKHFANNATFSALTLNLLRDDGAVVYLNGTEVLRSNIPAGSITSATPASAAVSGAAETTFFPSTIGPAALLPGANVVAVEIHQDSANSSDISFNMELSGVGNVLPSVALTFPANNATFAAPSDILLAAAASDPYGAVKRVEFFNGPTPLGTRTNTPHAMLWPAVPAGTYSLHAVVTDNAGATAQSAPVSVTVCPAPSVRTESAGGGLVLAWPANAPTFALQYAMNLTPPVSWFATTNTVLLTNGERRVLFDPAASHRFFRLHAP